MVPLSSLPLQPDGCGISSEASENLDRKGELRGSWFQFFVPTGHSSVTILGLRGLRNWCALGSQMRKADTRWEQEAQGTGQWFVVLGNHCPWCPGGCLACSRWAHLLFSSRPCKPLSDGGGFAMEAMWRPLVHPCIYSQRTEALNMAGGR